MEGEKSIGGTSFITTPPAPVIAFSPIVVDERNVVPDKLIQVAVRPVYQKNTQLSKDIHPALTGDDGRHHEARQKTRCYK
jgi:hypothetical protein